MKAYLPGGAHEDAKFSKEYIRRNLDIPRLFRLPRIMFCLALWPFVCLQHSLSLPFTSLFLSLSLFCHSPLLPLSLSLSLPSPFLSRERRRVRYRSSQAHGFFCMSCN